MVFLTIEGVKTMIIGKILKSFGTFVFLANSAIHCGQIMEQLDCPLSGVTTTTSTATQYSNLNYTYTTTTATTTKTISTTIPSIATATTSFIPPPPPLNVIADFTDAAMTSSNFMLSMQRSFGIQIQVQLYVNGQITPTQNPSVINLTDAVGNAIYAGATDVTGFLNTSIVLDAATDQIGLSVFYDAGVTSNCTITNVLTLGGINRVIYLIA